MEEKIVLTKKELLWGSEQVYNEAQKLNPSFIFSDSGSKISYRIDKFTKDTIPDSINKSGLRGKINKIYTGKGGKEMMEYHNNPFNHLTEVDNVYDPIGANDLINPVLESGYRLSSYMFLVDVGENLLKIIPINPFNNNSF